MSNPTYRTIQREEFQAAGFKVIDLASGEVEWPDGQVCRYSVRLQAMPGSEGDIVLIAEDINRKETRANPVRFKLRKAN